MSGEVLGGGGEFGDASFRIRVSESVWLGAVLRRKSADGLVAAGVFSFVEGAVGKAEDFFIAHVSRRSDIPREGGPANGNSAMNRKAGAFDFKGFAGDR